MTPRATASELVEASASLSARRRFAERNLVNKHGGRFTLPKSREWVLTNYWGAADGFKLWPIDRDALCTDCRALAGSLVYDWLPAHVSQSAQHRATGCRGLELQPIIVTVVCLPRQEGKTTNGMGFDLGTVFLQRDKYVLFVAASEAQTARLFDENYRNAIEAQPRLSKMSYIVGSTLVVPETNSRFQMVSTSASSAVGSSATHVRYDEAKDIPAKVFMALVPSIFARSGRECPHPGHFHIDGFEDERTECPVCKGPLRPWYGRLIVTSSAGTEDESADSAWFRELVEYLTEHPDPNFHLYRRDTSENPAIRSEVKAAVDRVFGQLESTRVYVEAEVHNRTGIKGGEFMSMSELERAMSDRIGRVVQSQRGAVAFLDTSIVGDLTTLAITLDGQVTDKDPPWHRLIGGAHLKVWDPREAPGGIIDDTAIEAYLRDVLPMFPNLRAIAVDDHFMPWATRMIKRLRSPARGEPSSPAWAKLIVSANTWKSGESQIGWAMLEEKARAGLLLLPKLQRIRDEIRGVRKRRRADGSVVVEDRNRERMHRDVTEAIACTLYLAHRQALSARYGLADSERTQSKSMLERLPRPVVKLRVEDF